MARRSPSDPPPAGSSEPHDDLATQDDLAAAVRAYAANLERNAAARRAGEVGITPDTYFAEAYLSCARDLGRILDGELTAGDLQV
jgi:hypothetical protein